MSLSHILSLTHVVISKDSLSVFSTSLIINLSLVWKIFFFFSPPTEKSCLLVCRSNKGSEVPLSPSLHRHNISQMVFHKIRKEDLEFVSQLCMFRSIIFPCLHIKIYDTIYNNGLPFRWRVWVKGHLPRSSKGFARSWETMDKCTKLKWSWKYWTRPTGIILRSVAIRMCKMFCFAGTQFFYC